MANNFEEFRQEIWSFLTTLRHSLDRPFRIGKSAASSDREDYLKASLLVEEARMRFRTTIRFNDSPSVAEWLLARRELLSFIKSFTRSKHVNSRMLAAPIRMMPSSLHRRPSVVNSMVRDAVPTTIESALRTFQSTIEDFDLYSSPRQESLSFTSLEKIIPQQQVAPIQFKVVKGKISIARRAPKKIPEDRQNIASALEHLRGSGQQLIANLKNSNCDRRLVESVEELQSQLVSDGNIIKIGLSNISCSVMCGQFEAELPDAIAAMFNSYSTNISLYVAQFPEWEQFTQKAAQIELDGQEIADVDFAAREIVDVLSRNADLVDSDVPKTIDFIRQLLMRPGTSVKRAAFAMIRTIENLVAGILHYSISLFEKTADKAVEGLSTVASKAIIGLLGIALVGATGIGPAAMRTGTPWVKQAAEIVQKQIEKMKE